MNFGPKQNGTVLSKRKMFGKEGPPFEVDRFFRMDRSDRKLLLHSKNFVFQYRLRVVSNLAMAIVGRRNTHARAKVRGDATRRKRRKLIFGAPFASRLLEISRARVYFVRPTIAIAKIRDYSQSISSTSLS